MSHTLEMSFLRFKVIGKSKKYFERYVGAVVLRLLPSAI